MFSSEDAVRWVNGIWPIEDLTNPFLICGYTESAYILMLWWISIYLANTDRKIIIFGAGFISVSVKTSL